MSLEEQEWGLGEERILLGLLMHAAEVFTLLLPLRYLLSTVGTATKAE
jgi:hypothetical protein